MSQCCCHFIQSVSEAGQFAERVSSLLFAKLGGTGATFMSMLTFLSSVILLDFKHRHARLFGTENTETLLKSFSKSPFLNNHSVYGLFVKVMLTLLPSTVPQGSFCCSVKEVGGKLDVTYVRQTNHFI